MSAVASRSTRAAARGSRNTAAGFVLAITLWLLAGITIAVGLMTLWAVDQVGQARIGHEMLEDEIAVHDTRDTLLYLASTRELTLAGLPTGTQSEATQALRRLDEFGGFKRDPIGDELSLDGSPYMGVGGTTFELQDEAGLYAMVWPGPAELERFLLAHGVDRDKIPRLRDTLLDYIDADDLNRLNGAESRDYEREKRSPPPNRRLLVPGELAQVMGWDELAPGQLSAIIEHITPYYSGAVNLNTMPPDLLPAWVAGCPETCERITSRRRQTPFHSSADLQAKVGVRLPGDDLIDYRYVAEPSLRLTLWGRTGAAWRMHVRLTPLADQQGPWSILAAYPVPRPSHDNPADETGSTLFTDQTPDRKPAGADPVRGAAGRSRVGGSPR